MKSVTILGKGVLMIACVVWAGTDARGQGPYTVSSPHGMFTDAGSASKLTNWTATVKDGTGGPASPGTPIRIQYTDGDGKPIGGPLTTTVDPNGNGTVTVPPPPIPAAAAGLGNKVIISARDPNGTWWPTKSLVWYKCGGWIRGAFGYMDLDPVGQPGSGIQSWFINETDASIDLTSPEFGSLTTTVVGSKFDLSYTDLGGGLFEARVSGNDSYMRLAANETCMSFPAGSLFGTIQYNPGMDTDGTFNFTAIGLGGTWHWDAGSNYTGATATSFSSFFASAIAITPEPASLALLVLGGLGALRRRRA